MGSLWYFDAPSLRQLVFHFVDVCLFMLQFPTAHVDTMLTHTRPLRAIHDNNDQWSTQHALSFLETVCLFSWYEGIWVLITALEQWPFISYWIASGRSLVDLSHCHFMFCVSLWPRFNSDWISLLSTFVPPFFYIVFACRLKLIMPCCFHSMFST